MSPPKVFLLGIDGATWKVLDRLIEKGIMPNLAKLTREGARGVLNSTIPALTPVAWSSLLTGVKPSKHGIFGYNVMENREGMIIGLLANRSRIKVPTVFDIYSQLGKKIVSVNMPMTYPACREDGTIITGMMTPSSESTFFYPPDLMSELRKQGIDYHIDINISREVEVDLEERIGLYLADNAKRLFEDLGKVTREREKTVLYLLSNKEWDLFQVNFVSMDRIQHFLWDHVLEDDSDSILLKRIQDQYSYVDSIIGRVYEEIKDVAILIVCSDHGFGDYKGNFYPTVWLKQNGYYADRGGGSLLGLTVKRVLKALGISRHLLRFLEKTDTTMAKKLIYIGTSTVYWKKTRAYLYAASGIRINLKGRDQYGTVEPGKELEDLKRDIKQGLLAITDSSGERILKNVFSAEELYGTTNLEEAPDLFLEFDEDHAYTIYEPKRESSAYLDKGYEWRKGDHRRDGVVLIAGDGVVGGKTITANIEDILPTILFVQDLPLSEDFDGRIITEAFTDDFISGRRVLDRRFFERGDVEASDTDKGDEVIDRLKGLGYI